MLSIKGQVLKHESFTSKKDKEMVSMLIFGLDKEVYNVLANFKEVARIDEGETVELAVNVLPGQRGVTYFVKHQIETEIA